MKLWVLEKANLKHMAYTPSKTPMSDEEEDGGASRDVLQVKHVGLNGDNGRLGDIIDVDEGIFYNDLDPLHVVEAEV